MTIWTPDLAAFDGPLYLKLVKAIEQGIVNGELPPQTRLPTHRSLADRLGVTVGTVTRAYSEAERRGLLAARVGHGTWVKGANTDPANEWVIRQEEGHRIELWQNLPVQLDRAAIIRPMLGGSGGRGSQRPARLRQGGGTTGSAPAVRRLAGGARGGLQ